MVISEASRNTRYGTESVVKTAIRNAACSLAKLASNLLWNYRLEIIRLWLMRKFRISEFTRHVP